MKRIFLVVNWRGEPVMCAATDVWQRKHTVVAAFKTERGAENAIRSTPLLAAKVQEFSITKVLQ